MRVFRVILGCYYNKSRTRDVALAFGVLWYLGYCEYPTIGRFGGPKTDPTKTWYPGPQTVPNWCISPLIAFLSLIWHGAASTACEKFPAPAQLKKWSPGWPPYRPAACTSLCLPGRSVCPAKINSVTVEHSGLAGYWTGVRIPHVRIQILPDYRSSGWTTAEWRNSNGRGREACQDLALC